MGNIVLITEPRNVNGEEKLTTTRVNYSTIGSDLICARIAQTANIKVTTGKSALLGYQGLLPGAGHHHRQGLQPEQGYQGGC